MAYSRSLMTSAADGLSLTQHTWTPENAPKAIVQISHGLAEHGARYGRFAEALNAQGYLVVAHDHRGHGESLTREGAYGDTGEAGWPGLVADIVQLTETLRDEHQDVPIFLLGHSMGSFAAQTVILDHGEAYQGVILSGSMDVPTALQLIMSTGQMPSFEVYNAAFAPTRTDFDWLSRDEAEVDAYIADPACGWDAPDSFTMSMMQHSGILGDDAKLSQLPKTLPILLLAGDKDPLNGGLNLLHALEARYKAAGLNTVDTAYYEDGRHEMLNEINREEVTSDLIKWLNSQI